jgi:F-type H+-transporting ATPase subunit b
MATGTEEAADAAAQAGGAVGMPQLDFSTWPNQIFWLVVTLAAIYFVLTRLALPRIGGVLAERNDFITNHIAEADDLKQKALKAEKAYGEALAQARANAAKIAAETRAAIQKDLDAAIGRADAQIAAKAAESEARITEIRSGAADAVAEVARATAQELVAALGGKADAASVTAAVDARLKG